MPAVRGEGLSSDLCWGVTFPAVSGYLERVSSFLCFSQVALLTPGGRSCLKDFCGRFPASDLASLVNDCPNPPCLWHWLLSLRSTMFCPAGLVGVLGR